MYALIHTCAYTQTHKSQILRMKKMKEKMLAQHSSLSDPALNLLPLIARGSSQSLLGGRRTRTQGRVVPVPLRCGPGLRSCLSHSRRRSSYSRLKGKAYHYTFVYSSYTCSYGLL